MAALEVDFHIEQAADWPGEAFFIVDAVGNPKPLTTSMVAAGKIVDPATGLTVLTWSSTPSVGQGLITYQGNLYIPTVDAALSAPWTFRTARYQLSLYDPAAPPGDRTIRVGSGSVYLSRQL